MSKTVVHRFLRQPNIQSSPTNRIGNRFNPFLNTQTVLHDPAKNRTLYLIGTTNSSTTLAYRTKKVIQQFQPNSLYVQASNNWWNYAKHSTASSQKQFNQISSQFQDEKYSFENNLRGILWRARYYTWMIAMNAASRFPQDFRPLTPGLQTKFALDEAEKINSNIYFGGSQFDPVTIEALKTETDMYFHTAFWRARIFLRLSNAWSTDFSDFYSTLHTRGGEAFSESIDRSRINLLVQLLNKISPKQKSIIVDQRDEKIFKDLYDIKSEKIVAVVNQWHMQGIETHWRRATGTQTQEEHLSPIADMDIDEYQERGVINNYLRDRNSKITNSEPATHQDMLTNYHKQNFQNERTRHTHHNSHEDVPNPGQQKKPHH